MEDVFSVGSAQLLGERDNGGHVLPSNSFLLVGVYSFISFGTSFLSARCSLGSVSRSLLGDFVSEISSQRNDAGHCAAFGSEKKLRNFRHRRDCDETTAPSAGFRLSSPRRVWTFWFSRSISNYRDAAPRDRRWTASTASGTVPGGLHHPAAGHLSADESWARGGFAAANARDVSGVRREVGGEGGK